jgi:hypothetical protein
MTKQARDRLIVSEWQANPSISQKALGAKHGLGQATISHILKAVGLSKPRTRGNVLAARRDGHINGHYDASEVEPYRILHPTVAELVSEMHYRPASSLRVSHGGLF